jgi:hypothetical protein
MGVAFDTGLALLVPALGMGTRKFRARNRGRPPRRARESPVIWLGQELAGILLVPSFESS